MTIPTEIFRQLHELPEQIANANAEIQLLRVRLAAATEENSHRLGVQLTFAECDLDRLLLKYDALCREINLHIALLGHAPEGE